LGTLKRVVVLLAVAGLLWAGWTVAGKVQHNRQTAAVIAELEYQEYLRTRPRHDFGLAELTMAKTQIPGNALSFSFVFKHAIWPGMENINLYYFGEMLVASGPRQFQIEGTVDPVGHAGQFGFIVKVNGGLPPIGYEWKFWYNVPADATGIYWIEIPCSFAYTGDTATKLTSGSDIIGEKSSPTHAKEKTHTEEWFISSGTEYTFTVGANTYNGTIGIDITTALSILISAAGIDADDWSDYMVGTKYTMSIEDIKFGDAEIDTSAYDAATWGCAAGANKLWVEGFGGNSIGFWASDSFYCGAYVYCDYPGGTINAPYSYDFSHYQFKWMDGTDVDESTEIYCTGFKQFAGTPSVPTVAPWKGTIAALRARGRYPQKYGVYFWESELPDMQGDCEMYFSLTSAEAANIEIRGPQPAYKVDGAGYGVVGAVPGPYDGQYVPDGDNSFTNGHGRLYCTDELNNDWGIGPGPPVDPFYIQVGGGPAGVYVVNLASYNDDLIGPGQRQFSGFAGYGIGPAVTANTDEAISVDSDCAVPSFKHDATCEWDGHGLDATDRTSDSRFTDVATLVIDADKSVYANAHDHKDWVGTDVSTPDLAGNFTVDPGGGSLLFTPKCNYRIRQAAVGAVGAISVPDCYRYRRHDSQLGNGNPVETAEAVWDWRGRYLVQSFKGLPLPMDVTCTITYYNDLGGASDNHKTDSTRQTNYAYDPGILYTLTRTIPVSYADGSGWSAIKIDLYDEVNQQPVAMAVTLTWEFPTAGTYQMSDPMLRVDTGDRQEIVAGAPGYRQAPANNGGSVKALENWRYTQGLVSAHVNGLVDRVLFILDNAKAAAIESVMDTLTVLYGAKSGIDMTSNHALSGWPITNGGEAWIWNHSTANEEAHMKDADGAVLKTLQVFDISPNMNLDASGTVITPSVAVRCYKMTCVRGIPYTFYGGKYVGTGVHGMKVTPASHDFPRARSVIGGDLYRRHLGSVDISDYTLVEADLSSDEHGHWMNTVSLSVSDVDAARTIFEYAVFDSTYRSMGRGATRQYMLLELLSIAGLEEVDMVTDAFDIEHAAATSGAALYALEKSSGADVWDDAVEISSASVAGYSSPGITAVASGRLVVAAIDADDGELKTWYSDDRGKTWTYEGSKVI